MKLVDLTCPKCGATIQVDADREFCFCSYCGAKSMIDNGTIHIIDEAKIREAEAMEKVQTAQTQADFELQKQSQESKSQMQMMIIAVVLVIVLYLFLMIMTVITK